MNSIINLGIWQVALAYIFVLNLIAIVRLRGIKREKQILISSIRMTLQLIITGYLLVYILDNPSPLVTTGIIILMETFAVFTVFRKFKGRLSRALKKSWLFPCPPAPSHAWFFTCLLSYAFHLGMIRSISNP